MTTSTEIAKDLHDKLSNIMTKMGIAFTIKGRPMSFAEAFSESGLLPAIAKRADQLAALCLGYGIGVTFEEEAGSMTGKKVRFDSVVPEAIRCLCIVDVLSELSKASADKRATALDELLYD